MSGHNHNDSFRREWDYHYLRSVHTATSVAFERAAWRPAYEAYVALAEELERRGVEFSSKAIYDGADQISQGRQPAILRAGSGRHRLPGGPAAPEGGAGNMTGRHARPGAHGECHDGPFS